MFLVLLVFARVVLVAKLLWSCVGDNIVNWFVELSSRANKATNVGCRCCCGAPPSFVILLLVLVVTLSARIVRLWVEGLKDTDLDRGDGGLGGRAEGVCLADDGHDFGHGVLLSSRADERDSVSVGSGGNVVVVAGASGEEGTVVGESWLLEHVGEGVVVMEG